MEAFEGAGSAIDAAETATAPVSRMRLPAPLRSAVSRILLWREALAEPAAFWWRSHGRRIVHIAALIVGGIAFLLVAHIVLSLLNPPSGL
jgi:hypothetical protein